MTAPSQTLLEENRRLRERLSELERKTFSLPGLTPMQNKIAALLYDAPGPMTREAIHSTLYDGVPKPPKPRIIDSQISRMREALGPLGVRILNSRQDGYSFGAEDRERIDQLRELAS